MTEKKPGTGSSGSQVFVGDGYQPSALEVFKKGFQASPSRDPKGIQGGYQGPTSQGAPANPPSGGSSGGSNKK